MQTGLAGLGDAFARAGDTYLSISQSNRLRDEARARQLEDEQRHRAYALEDHTRDRTERQADIKDQREYAEKLRQEAMMDDTIKQLLAHQYLQPSDLQSPNSQELVANALERSRKDGLAIEELARIRAIVGESFDVSAEDKAMLAQLDARIASSGDPKAGLAPGSGMDFARELETQALKGGNERAKVAYDQSQSNRTNAGKIVDQLFAEKAALTKDINDAYTGITTAEAQEIERSLQQQFGTDYPALAMKDKSGILSAARQKAQENILGHKYSKAQNAERRLREIDNQVQAVSIAAAKGALGYSSGAQQQMEAPPALGASPVKKPTSIDAFLGGAPAPAPAPAPAALAPRTAPLIPPGTGPLDPDYARKTLGLDF